MKTIIYFLFLLFPLFLHAGNIQQTSFGDFKVYLTQYQAEADLVVFMTTFSSEAKGQDAIWKWEPTGNIRAEITDIKTNADLIVYLTSSKSQAGWRRDHPLKGKLG